MADLHKQVKVKPLSSNHNVSADGSHITIDGCVFRRTVLPSVALPSKEEETIQEAIAEFDQIRTQEIESTESAE